jgi:hypothetical protein
MLYIICHDGDDQYTMALKIYDGANIFGCYALDHDGND